LAGAHKNNLGTKIELEMVRDEKVRENRNLSTFEEM
jgi:hypothetical protein